MTGEGILHMDTSSLILKLTCRLCTVNFHFNFVFQENRFMKRQQVRILQAVLLQQHKTVRKDVS